MLLYQCLLSVSGVTFLDCADERGRAAAAAALLEERNSDAIKGGHCGLHCFEVNDQNRLLSGLRCFRPAKVWIPLHGACEAQRMLHPQ